MTEPTPTFLNPSMPLPFCPGCGHGTIIQELDSALTATGWPADRIVIVTDIGCAGLSDRNFLTHGFHGLHGRSLTYATGIKLAAPDLHVVAILGDGGCGIGGNHLIHAARRNIGVTTLVFNNFNFGMTGGQHSVTTPTGGRTATTPWGNVERPLDLAGLVEAAGGTFVARAAVFQDDLRGLIGRALAHEGFAFVEIWDVCMSYYSPDLETFRSMVDGSGRALKVLRETREPELASSLRGLQGKAKPARAKEIAPLGGADLDRPVGVIVAGSAGQRIRSAATLLGQAAIASGLHATQKDDYDVLLLLSKEGLGQVKGRLAAMKPGSLVLADARIEGAPPAGVSWKRLPFFELGEEIGEGSVPVAALGAMLALRGLVPFEAFRRTASGHPNAAIARANQAAALKGQALVREASAV